MIIRGEQFIYYEKKDIDWEFLSTHQNPFERYPNKARGQHHMRRYLIRRPTRNKSRQIKKNTTKWQLTFSTSASNPLWRIGRDIPFTFLFWFLFISNTESTQFIWIINSWSINFVTYLFMFEVFEWCWLFRDNKFGANKSYNKLKKPDPSPLDQNTALKSPFVRSRQL